MKARRKIAWVLVFILIFSVAPTIKASAATSYTYQTFAYTGGSDTGSVTGASNYNYKIESKPSWVTIGQNYASYFSYTVSSNTTPIARTGVIVVKAGSNTREIHITQKAYPSSFSVSQTDFSVAHSGGTLTVNVTSLSPASLTTHFTVGSSSDWISCYSSSARSFHIRIAKNESPSARNGSFYISAKYNGATVKIITVSVNQKGNLNVGAAPDYEKIKRGETGDKDAPNCYAFAIGWSNAVDPGKLSDTYSNLYTTDSVFADLKAQGYSPRALSGPYDDVKDTEYRIAYMRSHCSGGAVQEIAYHVMLQTSDGHWAEVPTRGGWGSLRMKDLSTPNDIEWDASDRYKASYPNSIFSDSAIAALPSYRGNREIYYYAITPSQKSTYYNLPSSGTGGGSGGSGGSGGGSGSTNPPQIVWPDPIGNPDARDFYLIPNGGGNYTVTHGAWKNADVYYSQSWIVDRYDDGSKATFRIEPNNTTGGRDGSVRVQIGGNVVECIRYLQCGKTEMYTVTLPAYGGSKTITLPYGYQYTQYGTLKNESRPDWVDSPRIVQNGDSNPTITISADYASQARNGVLEISMGNSRDGSYTIARINVTQEAFTGTEIPGDMNVKNPDTNFVLAPSSGVNPLSSDGKYTVTHGAWSGAEASYSQLWMVDRYDDGWRAMFRIETNNTNSARDGSVRVFHGGAERDRIHYLQCGQPTTYSVTLSAQGGSQTITLPYGYQYSQYGSLTYGTRPVWVNRPTFVQGQGDAYATVTISAGAADLTRNGIVPIMMGNTAHGIYAIANISVTQIVSEPATPANIWIHTPVLNMEPAETYTLAATLVPANVQNKTVTWTSSNTAAATVSSAGVVTAVNSGMATITATTANGLTATCSVTVKNPAVPVSTDTSHLHFDAAMNSVGDGLALSVEVEGSYTVSASSWLHCSRNGSELRVTCDENTSGEIRFGTLTIKGENGSQAVVTVKQSGAGSAQPVSKETLFEALKKAEAFEVDLDLSFSENYEAFMCAFYAGAMVYGDQYARQTSVDAAATALHAALEKLVVSPTGITISLASKTMVSTTTAQLSATVTPDNATDKSVIWSSSDSSVATVTEGRVVALKGGKTVISAATADGKFTATCTVTVTTSAISIKDVLIYKTNIVSGEKTYVSWSVFPYNTTDKTTLTSSNPRVATVESNGTITGVGPGKATITIAAGKASIRLTITVHNYVTLKIGSTVAIKNGKKTSIDSASTKPFKISGKTMLPLRFVGEKMGGKVKYINDKQPIIMSYGNTRVEFRLGDRKMKVITGSSSKTITLDVPAQKVKGKTYIPLRAIGQALGFDIFYQSGTEYIVVNNPSMTEEIRNERLREAKKII